MKKLKLNSIRLGANEVLSRAQLKNILGGGGDGSGGSPLPDGCPANCYNNSSNCKNAACPICKDCGGGIYLCAPRGI